MARDCRSVRRAGGCSYAGSARPVSPRPRAASARRCLCGRGRVARRWSALRPRSDGCSISLSRGGVRSAARARGDRRHRGVVRPAVLRARATRGRAARHKRTMMPAREGDARIVHRSGHPFATTSGLVNESHRNPAMSAEAISARAATWIQRSRFVDVTDGAPSLLTGRRAQGRAECDERRRASSKRDRSLDRGKVSHSGHHLDRRGTETRGKDS